MSTPLNHGSRSRPHARKSRSNGNGKPPLASPEASVSAEPATRPLNRWAWAVLLPLTAAFAWAYWPTLVELVAAWNREPDYSHGFLVFPVALYMLWVRRHTFPGLPSRLRWSGLVLILGSIGVRYGAALMYAQAPDAWSMLLWLAGVVVLFCGWRGLQWSWPAVAFLWFMAPLPYGAEHALSRPLQHVATLLSTWSLQCLGLPALAEGNTILIDQVQLEVEQACSGLRIFVGIVALAFVYVVLVRRSWWVRLLLVLSVIPVALVANAARIVATGVIYQWVADQSGRKLVHDVSGWLMIPLAATLFAVVLWYVGKLIREVPEMSVAAAIRQHSIGLE